MEKNHFGNLMRSIRAARGMYQADVAHISGASRKSVYSAESSEDCTVRQNTLDLILTALAFKSPLTDDEISRLAKATDRHAASFQSLNALAKAHNFDSSTAAPSTAESRRDRLKQAIEAIVAGGCEDEVVEMIESIAAWSKARQIADAASHAPSIDVAEHASDDAAKPRRIRVLHPERQGDIPGSIVQDITNYDVHEGSSEIEHLDESTG